MIDHMGNGRSERDGYTLLSLYREIGLNLEVVGDSEQSGVSTVLQKIRSGRLKVFRTLDNFFRRFRLYRWDAEGRAVKQDDLLMNCLRYLCTDGEGRMRTEPVRRLPEYRVDPKGPYD